MLTSPEQQVFTPRELAQARGVSLRTVRTWMTMGVRGVRLQHGYRTGRHYEITQAQVDAFFAALAQQRRQQRPQAVPREFRRARPSTRADRQQTAATLRSLGVEV